MPLNTSGYIHITITLTMLKHEYSSAQYHPKQSCNYIQFNLIKNIVMHARSLPSPPKNVAVITALFPITKRRCMSNHSGDPLATPQSSYRSYTHSFMK